MKTDNMFCVHTTAFYRRRNCLISLWACSSKQNIESVIVPSRHSKFSLHSSATTTSFTKLSHHALVLLGRVQKRLCLWGWERRVAFLVSFDFNDCLKLFLIHWRTIFMWTKAILNSKYAIKEKIIVNNTENIVLSAMSNFWPREIWEDKSQGKMTWAYSKSSGYEKYSVHTNTKKLRFQIVPLTRTYSKISVFADLFMRICAL